MIYYEAGDLQFETKAQMQHTKHRLIYWNTADTVTMVTTYWMLKPNVKAQHKHQIATYLATSHMHAKPIDIFASNTQQLTLQDAI